MTVATFADQLYRGKVGESLIADWLKRQGYHILPVYEKEIHEGKGPQVFSADWRGLIAPDLLAFKLDRARWIEAKHKSVFSWHRITGRWVTGINLNHYEDYQRIAELSPWAVYLMFLHSQAVTNEPPYRCPTGLFGGNLAELRCKENHRSALWGKSGMVYWAENTLTKFATLESVHRGVTRPVVAA